MKYELISKALPQYKAGMHIHTNISDGKFSPEDVKAYYKNLGFSILAFTDHEVLASHNDLTDDGFLAITSFEIAVNEEHAGTSGAKKCYHLNLYAKDKDNTISSVFNKSFLWLESMKPHVNPALKDVCYPRVYSVEAINEIIRRANEEGFLVSYNHPLWSQQDYPDYAGLEGLWGVEVYNHGCFVGGWVEHPQAYYDLLHMNKRVFPLCTDDSHSRIDCGGGWIMVTSPALEYGAVMNALEKGDFYASTGPEIKEFYVENGVAHVSCSEAVSVTVLSERRSVVHKSGTAENPLTEVTLDLSTYLSRTKAVSYYPTTPFIRLEVIDKYGKTAYTRAYSFEEFGETLGTPENQ